MRAGLAVVLLCAANVGCTVSPPPDLQSRLWTCEVASDCLDGWGCADGNAIAPDFCRPACDPADPSTCDGDCTRTHECLARCLLQGDHTTPCPDGQACVRSDLMGDEGVCFPVTSCSRSTDCHEPFTACLNDVLDLPVQVEGVPWSTDHLYCLAVPDADGRCPSAYLSLPGMGGPGACIPRCDSEGSRCPPMLTCLRAMGWLLAPGNASVCLPGGWGLPCEDDAQCLIGRCLPIAAGGPRACTVGCAEAQARFGFPCAGFSQVSGAVRADAVSVGCETVGGQDVCVPRGLPGAPCNDDMLCAAGLECRSIVAGPTTYRFCSIDCMSDADCDLPGVAPTAYCVGGVCAPRSPEGGQCTRSAQCRPGLVCTSLRCVVGGA